ncbi:DUF3224 domain-containing protein [Bailinhaonella thermotolerans]|uniref:DUF3224 domain-containing protein n=1 Tax=Bailinhaonella thermotolerans TaxID=1070861 RepID=A0A3A4AS96_9ACTN|nr:DUF3224 domain-containing protein [Bailinhaonella thermotolerans]RJL24188.1 DUF3224 domain-containing protein [Bailinhaonella thermotolerans]
MPRATGTFEVTRWDATPYDDRDGLALARVEVGKTFHGDVEGTAEAALTTASTPVEGSMAYVAIERMTVSVHGRSGVFLLQHGAAMERGRAEGLWVTVVPDSGSGELAGISGRMWISVNEDGGHDYALEYELP